MPKDGDNKHQIFCQYTFWIPCLKFIPFSDSNLVISLSIQIIIHNLPIMCTIQHKLLMEHGKWNSTSSRGRHEFFFTRPLYFKEHKFNRWSWEVKSIKIGSILNLGVLSSDKLMLITYMLEEFNPTRNSRILLHICYMTPEWAKTFHQGHHSNTTLTFITSLTKLRM